MNSNGLRLTFVTTEISQEIKLKEEAWAPGWACPFHPTSTLQFQFIGETSKIYDFLKNKNIP
jgi:hypothetical protein